LSRKLGLFGGSFDPIHYGHIQPAQEARAELGLERVVFLPTAVPPHKPDRQFAPPHARYTMVELALLSEEGLFASPAELTIGRPAYTIETLERFSAEESDASLHLLIGSDSFGELETWRRWREIAGLARLAVLTRPGWRFEDTVESLPRELVELARSGEVDFVANQPITTSSTALRRMLAAGEEPPEGAIPSLVLEYIRKHSLYQ
jgi:nicotinate-nucleotide adenylyltransferase